MSFFMNVYDFEFRGSLLTADRQYTPNFKIKANVNRPDYMLCSNIEPYNLSVNDTLTLSFCFDQEFNNYSDVSINIAGSTPSATTSQEIVALLNNDDTFKSFFVASLYSLGNTLPYKKKILIKSIKQKNNFKAYVVNSSAEAVLGFNKNAPIAELPKYFERYAIQNRFDYPDIVERLLLLDPSNSVESDYITAAGFLPGSPTPDWQLLNGQNDQYMFTKRTYQSGFVQTEIKYPAGATLGDAAFKTTYEYNGSNLIGVCQIPHVLVSGDLIIPV